MYSKARKLSDLTGFYKGLYSMNFSGCLLKGNRYENMEVTIVHRLDGIMAVIDERNWDIILEFHPKVDEFYYDSSKNQTIVIKQGLPYFLDSSIAESIQFAERNWVDWKKTSYEEKGLLYGQFENQEYEAEEVRILVGGSDVVQVILCKSFKLLSSKGEKKNRNY